MASVPPRAATAPRTGPRDPPGSVGPQCSSACPQPVFLGFVCGRLFWQPPRKAQPLDRSVPAASFGRGKVEEARRRVGEGGGRRKREEVPRRIWQMASRLPSLKWRAGVRGSAVAPRPPNSWSSPVLGATSSLAHGSSPTRLPPRFPPCPFSLKGAFHPSFSSDPHSPDLPRLHSPGLPIPPAAREDARPALGEAKKKNLSERFPESPLSPFSGEFQPRAGPVLSLGKFLRRSAPSWTWHGVGCGIRSVWNPVERVAGARKSPSADARVALPARTREFAGLPASSLSSG